QVTFSGHVTATNGGQALPQQAVAFAAQNALTDAGGAFSFKLLPTTGSLLISGSGILTRSLTAAAMSSRDIAVDAIARNGVFDETFYRQIVRNGLDGSGVEPIRRWTRNPNIYLQTGTDAKTLDMAESVIRDAIPRWTAGTLSVASVERGTDSRVGQAG